MVWVWLLSFSRWSWFQFFYFHPETLGKWSILTSFFSNGLVQPPPMGFSFSKFYEKRGANFFWMTSGFSDFFSMFDQQKSCTKVEGCKYWVVDFHPYLGKISNLTNIFQRSWNHQLEYHEVCFPLFFAYSPRPAAASSGSCVEAHPCPEIYLSRALGLGNDEGMTMAGDWETRSIHGSWCIRVFGAWKVGLVSYLSCLL